ncbi:hypothetical protein NQ315_008327 [Exocentrus adspersus]|uniref:Double jelly roll-like domain-containing protein n=1 Tax=Exocentrus adspersus TaxID=1586481 RepID=A0AAV8VBX6_9CUCU|nr:hypothetical protein NQ315_008327 [Exocentrus adspersus]
MDILNVNAGIYFDDAVTSAEKHTHQAYASTSLNNNDEIRIPIQQQDLYTLPNESSLYIKGKLLKTDNTPSRTAKFVNNGVMLLFDEIRYEIGGYVIDRIRNPGLTSIIKGYVSFNKNAAQFLQNSGWFLSNNEQSNIVDDNGNFNVVIDLSTIFGFCEDYRKIILNMRQELVLIRSNSDTNAIINSTKNEGKNMALVRKAAKAVSPTGYSSSASSSSSADFPRPSQDNFITMIEEEFRRREEFNRQMDEKMGNITKKIRGIDDHISRVKGGEEVFEGS